MNWKQAFALGLCSVGEYKGEPVAYLYNEVRLPRLPELKYPYVVIWGHEAEGRMVMACSAPFIVKNGQLKMGGENSYSYVYAYATDDNKGWNDLREVTGVSGGGVGFASYTVWTNTDILNEDGSVYLAATDPIPVYE